MNYLDRAIDDLEAARLMLSSVGNPTNDEGKNDIAAYHVQQCAEKALKHILNDINGIDDTPREFRTHDIPYLIRWVERSSEVSIPDSLKEIAIDLTGWETTSRYASSIVSVREEVSSAADICGDFLKQVEEYENRSQSGMVDS